jgi:hypothetical protein
MQNENNTRLIFFVLHSAFIILHSCRADAARSTAQGLTRLILPGRKCEAAASRSPKG